MLIIMKGIMHNSPRTSTKLILKIITSKIDCYTQ